MAPSLLSQCVCVCQRVWLRHLMYVHTYMQLFVSVWNILQAWKARWEVLFLYSSYCKTECFRCCIQQKHSVMIMALLPRKRPFEAEKNIFQNPFVCRSDIRFHIHHIAGFAMLWCAFTSFVSWASDHNARLLFLFAQLIFQLSCLLTLLSAGINLSSCNNKALPRSSSWTGQSPVVKFVLLSRRTISNLAAAESPVADFKETISEVKRLSNIVWCRLSHAVDTRTFIFQRADHRERMRVNRGRMRVMKIWRERGGRGRKEGREGESEYVYIHWITYGYI